jgi:hypothetical protein
MSYPRSEATYRHCIVCGRPFRVQPAEARRRASAHCTMTCYWKSVRAFRRALRAGLLERILSLSVVRGWLEEDTRIARRYGERSHNRKLVGGDRDPLC